MMVRSCAFALIACPLVLAAGCSKPPNVTVAGNSPFGEEGLHVSGTATVRAKPDYALLTLGYECSGSRALKTKETNSEAMGRILAAVRSQGVEPKDIQTTDYTISSDVEGLARRRVTVWHVSNHVRVKVRKVENVSAVVDAATDAGADFLGNITFLVEDMNALKAKARDAAAKVAREKAEQLAKDLGAHIARVVAIRDGSASPYPWSYGYNMNGTNTANAQINLQSTRTGAADQDPENVVSEGQISVEAREEVVYALD